MQADFTDELPFALGEDKIKALLETLVGEPTSYVEDLFWNCTNLDYMYIPESRQLLIEAEGEQRRASKRKHISVEIG